MNLARHDAKIDAVVGDDGRIGLADAAQLQSRVVLTTPGRKGVAHVGMLQDPVMHGGTGRAPTGMPAPQRRSASSETVRRGRRRRRPVNGLCVALSRYFEIPRDSRRPVDLHDRAAANNFEIITGLRYYSAH
jgi:hypothetical protein